MAFEFVMPLSPFAKTYCDSIATQMMVAFGVSADEAAGRINRHWHDSSFVEQEDIDVLLHETPDYWARRIYYPSEVNWWVTGEEGLTPRPYPDRPPPRSRGSA